MFLWLFPGSSQSPQPSSSACADGTSDAKYYDNDYFDSDEDDMDDGWKISDFLRIMYCTMSCMMKSSRISVFSTFMGFMSFSRHQTQAACYSIQ